MTKKKIRIGRRRKTHYKPRSNDSGVSLKSTHITNNDTVKNLGLDSCTSKETNETFKNSTKVEDSEETYSDQQLKLVPLVTKSELAFIEDEVFLDYEPSDDDVDINYSAENHMECITKVNEDVKRNNCDGNTEIPFEADLETPVHIERITESKLLNSTGSMAAVPNLSHSFDDTGMLGKTSSYMNNERGLRNEHSKMEEEILDEDFDHEEESELSDENHILSEEDEQDAVNNLFGNAKVHFNGPLNITITRPVINNTQSQISVQSNNNVVPDSNVSSPVIYSPPKVRIHNMSTLVPGENTNPKNDLQKKKWSNALPEPKYARVMSNDEIFRHNFVCIGELEEIDSKLVGEEEINSEHSRSSTSDGDALLNREEYELQENDKDAFVARWLMHNNEDYYTKLLDSLCESHFTTGCSNLRCSNSHSMDEIKMIIYRSSFQELEGYYRITLKKDSYFTMLFDVFLDRFKVIQNGEMMLIDMINDVHTVFNRILTDKTSFIVKIIQSLRDIGLSFKQAIKRIILRYGTTQLWICDILLFIIAAEPNLEDHWCLVQKITCCRKEKIDHKVVTEVLNACFRSTPLNKELCRRIYQDIFEKDLVDMTKIPHHLKTLIVKMTGNLMEPERTLQSPVSSNESEKEYYRPMNPILRNLQRETFSSDEGCLPQLRDRNEDTSEGLLNSYAPNDMEQDVPQNGEQNSQKKKLGKLFGIQSDRKSRSSSVVKSSRTVRSRVLRNVAKTLNTIPKSHTPANFIAHPSFQPIIDPLYQCNISLHNLLPKVQHSLTDITTTDLCRLKNALKDNDSVEILELMQSYSDPYSIENFIVNVLTLLKSFSNSSMFYSMLMSLLNAVDKMGGDKAKETYVKVPLEVLALNLIYTLNVKGHSSLSRNILFKVKDWHSLVTSKIFLGKPKLKSHMGRYIYIINVLIQAGDFFWANEIFQAEVLNLLGPTSSWPYEYKPSDKKARNQVLESFLEKCFQHNIFITNDLLKHIVIVHNGSVEDFDLWNWFNKKILSLMEDRESNTSVLLYLSKDIDNYYDQFMDKFVLQAYMLTMVDTITSEMALNLFKKCCSKGIYHEYTGREHAVLVRTNFTDFEIASLLQCFFKNFLSKRVSFHDFYIDLIPPDLLESSTTEKYRMNRNVYKVFESVCNILDSKFGIKIDQPVLSRIFVSLSN